MSIPLPYPSAVRRDNKRTMVFLPPVPETFHVAVSPSGTYTGYAQIKDAQGELVAVVMPRPYTDLDDRDDAATLSLARNLSAAPDLRAACEAEGAADTHHDTCPECLFLVAHGAGWCSVGTELKCRAQEMRVAALAKADGQEATR